jgi:hypothetical protein
MQKTSVKQPAHKNSTGVNKTNKFHRALTQFQPLITGKVDVVCGEGHMALAMGAKWSLILMGGFHKSSTLWQRGTPPPPHTAIPACPNSKVASNGIEDYLL